MNIICKYNNFLNKKNLIVYLLNKYFSILKNKIIYNLCGRIIAKNIIGSIIFIKIRDISGVIQIYLSKCQFGVFYNKIINYINIGDLISVKGYMYVIKSKQLNLRVFKILFLSKNMFVLSNFFNLKIINLIINYNNINLFIFRFKLIILIKKFFFFLNYLEVETPIIQNFACGANAKPFITYHKFLNKKLFLRISPELSLKKLIVSGFEKIFEIGKNFRNESISHFHNPEFTMIEFYQSYLFYKDLIFLTKLLFNYLFYNLKNKLLNYNDVLLMKTFKELLFYDILLIFNKKININDLCNLMILFNYLNKLNDIHIFLFIKNVEYNLLNPIFVIHHPISDSLLSKINDNNFLISDRFEFYINCVELINAFSELNNPINQYFNFLNKNKYIDIEYLNFLKIGLPSTSGEGIGVDRLIMIFNNIASIKDILFFSQ